ncbi:unnamed protein product [Rotaria socialis]|uniref:Carbonic anhydrase n=1 Tax=Rotaria socialis TaxID=392032 RepID=A0A817T5F5_9BILA|nr:unnamed protein product [Rotaria socialis]CAF4474076.1 unnamed protein product [Rotaria socialis]
MLKFILITVLFLPIAVESKDRWTFENSKAWPATYKYCGGNLQSPIDLKFQISHVDPRLKQLYFKELYSREPLELSNNGYSAQLELKNHYVLKNVAPESEDYKVEQIHFHWGHSEDYVNGSEHLLEGLPYPLEMHIVTYSSWFSNFSEAVKNTRALAVIGVFFEFGKEDNSLLEPIVKTLKHIQHKGQTVFIDGNFDLKALIDEKRLYRYYRYDGSLTNPPCYESVIWNVLPEPLQLSVKQLNAFQTLRAEKSQLIKNTYRSIQPLGSRKLFRSFYSQDIQEDDIQRKILVSKGHDQYSFVKMKFSFVLISLLLFTI